MGDKKETQEEATEALRGFRYEDRMVVARKEAEFPKRWRVIGNNLGWTFYRHTLTRGISERKGPKEATVALSRFER